MSEHIDEVEVDLEYRSPDVPLQSAKRLSHRKKGSCTNYIEKTRNILKDPIFIELFVVVVVIGGAVLSSELAIHVGEFYSERCL